MPQIRLERTLRVPADPGAVALGELLQAIADQEGPWRGFALHIGFGDLHFPDVGYVAVPISLKCASARTTRMRSTSRLGRRTSPPRFRRLTAPSAVEPAGLGECRLLLQGGYDLPMQIFGTFLDTALTPNLAQRSLENFIDEIARGEPGARGRARSRVRTLSFLRHNLR